MFHQLTLRPTASAVAKAPGSVIERCEGLRFALLDKCSDVALPN